MSNHRVTLKQVAAAAGCSIGAVSVVLNDTRCSIRVSPPTARRIRDAAERLGYVSHYHPRRWQAKTSFMIGVILGERAHRNIGNGYWGHYVAALDNASRERGYDLLLIGPAGDQSEVDRAIRHAKQNHVAGLIGYGGYGPAELKALDALHHPLVFIREGGTSGHPVVDFEEGAGLREAVHLLLANGHRTVTYVTPEPEYLPGWSRRVRAVRRVTEDLGLQLEVLTLGEALSGTRDARLADQVRGAYDAVLRRCRQPVPPTALLFYNDAFAIGGMQGLRDAGLTVPGAVSVVSFDDVWGAYCLPPLTEVNLQLDLVAKRAVGLVIELGKGPRHYLGLRGHREYVPVKLVARGSVGAASGRG